MEILRNILAIIGVVLVFNFMIFFHELGHFLAAKWRGLTVDKFYIWFGKPLWKKTIRGVEYGIGSIPAGGFVALPQMAPMESIEGGDSEKRKQLPPISPLDKIIVAFAGPLFSFLLAVIAACVVWGLGKPNDTVHSTVVGYILPGSPAEQAGLQIGDRMISVDGEKVMRFLGGLDGLKEKIMLSENETVDLVVQRDGELVTLTSEFTVPESAWFQRRAMRQIGISWADKMIVEEVSDASPAERAGLQAGDRILSLGGISVISVPQLGDVLKAQLGKSSEMRVMRAGVEQSLMVESMVPLDKVTEEPHPDGRPMMGARFESPFDLSLVHPKPFQQIKDSAALMLKTIQAITAKNSNVGIEHLSGPVGIGTAMFDFLTTDYALNRIFWFMVVLNINLAIMNLMPFPVLDGGHIVLAIGEWIRGRPVQLRLLEIVQTGFVFVLLGLFVYVTSKDIGDLIPGRKEKPWGQSGIVWPTVEIDS